MIIGISGKLGSGKDTVGKIIQYLTSNEYNKMSYSSFCLLETRWYNSNDFIIKKFAGKLKQIVSILTGISVEDLEKEEVKNSVLGEEWKIWECYGAVTNLRYIFNEKPKGNPHKEIKIRQQ